MRAERRRVDGDLAVERRALVGAQARASPTAASIRRRAVRPSTHAKVVSSGAIMPARPPPSIVMLQIVMRPSIESASMAGAGELDDVADGAVDAHLADRAEDQVLGGDAGAERAVVVDAHRLRAWLHEALRGQHVLDLARADAEGERAERAVRRRVAVAADDRHARLGDAELRPDDVDDALALGAERVDAGRRTPRSCARASRPATRLSSSLMRAAIGVPSVGTLWSAVASVRSGRRTVRPARRRPSNACGLVTSWTRCRSM